MDRVLIKGGTVLTMEPEQHARHTDVLISGETIEAIADDLEVDARVVDATGCIVLPGSSTPTGTWAGRATRRDSRFGAEGLLPQYPISGLVDLPRRGH